MNWRTTIALQKISNARKTNENRLRRKTCMKLLLRQGNDFGN